jgi:hypothetical protein
MNSVGSDIKYSTAAAQYRGKKKKNRSYILWACLVQVSFTSKVVFLENSSMNDFLDEAKLFWKNCLAK